MRDRCWPIPDAARRRYVIGEKRRISRLPVKLCLASEIMWGGGVCPLRRILTAAARRRENRLPMSEVVRLAYNQNQHLKSRTASHVTVLLKSLLQGQPGTQFLADTNLGRRQNL